MIVQAAGHCRMQVPTKVPPLLSQLLTMTTIESQGEKRGKKTAIGL